MALRQLGHRLKPSSRTRLKPAAKIADPDLQTSEHERWRLIVCERAGWRCEWIEGGVRCPKSAPGHVMIADHIRERKDGGALYDPANGQCLCVQHNTLKGIRARAARRAQQQG